MGEGLKDIWKKEEVVINSNRIHGGGRRRKEEAIDGWIGKPACIRTLG